MVVVSHFAGICQYQLLALCLSFHRRLLLLLPLLLLCLSKVLVALKVAFWNRWKGCVLLASFGLFSLELGARVFCLHFPSEGQAGEAASLAAFSASSSFAD